MRAGGRTSRSGSAARSASGAIGFGQASPASSHHSHSSRAWLKAAVTRVAAPARPAFRSGCVRATRSFQARRISSALSGASSPSSHCARAIWGYEGARLGMPSGYSQGMCDAAAVEAASPHVRRVARAGVLALCDRLDGAPGSSLYAEGRARFETPGERTEVTPPFRFEHWERARAHRHRSAALAPG